MPVESASFLSGCTVLAMTAFSVGRTFLEGNRAIDVVRGTPLAAGAGIGGVAGQFLFSQIAGTASDTDALGMVQTGILFFVTLGTLVYTLFEHKVTTLCDRKQKRLRPGWFEPGDAFFVSGHWGRPDQFAGASLLFFHGNEKKRL